MTRIERARRNLRITRSAIGIAVVGAFALFSGLARASHPATHHAIRTTSTSVTQDDSYFGDDSSSSSYLGPSGSATPQIQSGAS